MFEKIWKFRFVRAPYLGGELRVGLEVGTNIASPSKADSRVGGLYFLIYKGGGETVDDSITTFFISWVGGEGEECVKKGRRNISG